MDLDSEIRGPGLQLTQWCLEPDGRQFAFAQVGKQDTEVCASENFQRQACRAARHLD